MSPAHGPVNLPDSGGPWWEAPLVGTARRWIQEALKSWVHEDCAAVNLHAPIAVEHLLKAALWQVNPVLIRAANHEATLVALATNPAARRSAT